MESPRGLGLIHHVILIINVPFCESIGLNTGFSFKEGEKGEGAREGGSWRGRRICIILEKLKCKMNPFMEPTYQSVSSNIPEILA